MRRLAVIEIHSVVWTLVAVVLFVYLAWALNGSVDDAACDVYCGPGNFAVTTTGLLLFPIVWFVAVGVSIGGLLSRKWLVASTCVVLLVAIAMVLAVLFVSSH